MFYPSKTNTWTVLLVTAGVLVICLVVFSIVSVLLTPVAGLLGTVICIGIFEWKVSDLFELRSPETDADPGLVIERRGILIDGDIVENGGSDEVVSIPWADLRGVYFDRQRTRGVTVQEWLAIEVDNFDGSRGLLEKMGMQFALGDSSRAEAYIVNTDAFHATYEDIEAAIDRCSDAFVEESDHSINFDPV